MELKEKQKLVRYCLFESGKGPISISLTVSKDIVAGADFKLYMPDSDNFLKQFKLGAHDGGNAVFKIPVDTKLMHKCVLTWQLLVCSKILELEIGRVYFDVMQSDKICKVTVPTVWNFNELPPCAVKAYSKHTESLVFMVKT